MSDKKTINIDIGWLVILLFVLAFCGKPDLHDAMIKHYMECGK